ncbi:MAG: 50S ribosomal protein L10 [Nanoarchaeota archaeon]
MTGKKAARVSEKKKTLVSELADLIKKKKTVLIASIKNIPSSQYQEISKKLRGKAIVKVPKKSMIFRALDNSGIEKIKKLKTQIEGSTAILFSDIESFDLAADLVSKKSPSKAKPGQEAPLDIEIPEGPTDLVPGPAISELGALGIKIQIEKGKIMIKEPKVIAKKGEKISQAAAEMMTKLGIRPFSIGLIPIAAFDTKEEKLYLDIRIDPEGTLKELKGLFSKSMGFAVNLSYTSKDTINFLIQKAGRQEITMEKFVNEGLTEQEGVVNMENNNQNGEVSELKVNEGNN